jgi:hypothetical protein
MSADRFTPGGGPPSTNDADVPSGGCRPSSRAIFPMSAPPGSSVTTTVSAATFEGVSKHRDRIAARIARCDCRGIALRVHSSRMHGRIDLQAGFSGLGDCCTSLHASIAHRHGARDVRRRVRLWTRPPSRRGRAQHLALCECRSFRPKVDRRGRGSRGAGPAGLDASCDLWRGRKQCDCGPDAARGRWGNGEHRADWRGDPV